MFDFVEQAELPLQALEASAIASCLVSPDGAFVWVNAALCELLGRPASQLVTCSWQELTHPDDLQVDLGLVAEVIAGKRPAYRLRKRFIRADDSVVWGDLTVSGMHDASGALMMFLSQIVDITAEVEAEQAVRLSEAIVAAALEAEIEGRVILQAVRDDNDTIVDFTFTEANAAACTGMGIGRDDLLGRRLLDPFPGVAVSGRLDEYVAVVESGAPAMWDERPVGTSLVGERRYLDARVVKVGDGVSYAFRDVTDRVEANQRLAESEARMRLLTDNTRDIVVLAEPDGAMTYVSPAITRVLGYAPEDIVGHGVGEFVHPEDLPILAGASQSVDGGQGTIAVARFRRPDGSYTWIESSIQPVLGPDGTLVSRTAVWRDITDRLESERRVRESEEHYRLLAENSSDVVLQASEGIMRWLSPSLTPMLGWDPIEWVGRRFEDFTHPDDVQLAQQRRNEINAGAARVTTLRLRNRSGAYHWVEIHAGPSMDAEGHQTGIVASFRIVDAEVAAQEALRAAEEHYRLLAENSIDVIGHIRDGRIAWISPSVTAALGGLPTEWVGRSLAETVHPDDLRRHLADLELGGEAVEGVTRVRVRASDGTYHWIEAHTGPFRDAQGKEDGFIAAFRIVDDVVAAEQELDYRARFDTLTGLANRKEVLERISSIATSVRKPGEHTAVLFCDVDHFKEVNDTHGHAAGDEVLRTLAERISANIRQGDIAARIGGDELLIILTGLHNLGEATAVAEKIRDASSVSIGLETGRVTSTLSIGVTLVRPGENTDSVVARADAAMYEAKTNGRNRVVTVA